MTTSKAVQSQAFGFVNSLKGSVDTRTGLYTIAIHLPEILSNWLCGPRFPLDLGFNPINTQDSGYGTGWNLNLTQFTPHDSMLALRTGETYMVTGSGATPDIKEKKLDSFHFENLGNGRYRLEHKSGLVEVLEEGGSSNDRVALPVEIYSPSGHCIKLVYASFGGGQRLESISDAQGELLRINRVGDQRVELLARPDGGPDGGPLARYEMELNASGWVTKIVLPTADMASWRFGYGDGPIRGILCLHEVRTPFGGLEKIFYGDTGHPYPESAKRLNLPRVTRHISEPGFGQSKIQVDFSYTTKNFLGAGAPVIFEPGMDSLYKEGTRYLYGTVAQLMDGATVVRTVERTYNGYHLPTEETTTQDKCVKRVKTEYYATDVAFEQQVAQFQLPKTVTTSWEMANDATQYRAEVATSTFDEHGNQTEQVEANGIKTTYSYYPKAGEDGGCPADRFVRNLKDTIVTPSPQGGPGAPTLRTRLRYGAQKPLNGSELPDWLAIESETLSRIDDTSEKELQQTRRTYNDETDDAFLHGRPATQKTTMNGKTSTTLYAYEKLTSVLAGENVLQTTEKFTGYDDIEKSIAQQNSLITGETVLSSDLDGVQLLHQFDVLGRVTKEIVSPAFPDTRAERVYRYTLAAEDGQQASQSVTDVSGVTTLTRYDGQGRMIYQEYAEKSEAPRQNYAATYDALGNCIKEIRYDWLGDERMSLPQHHDYDAWGVACRTTDPDGSVNSLLWSPFGKSGPVEYSWRETPGAQTAITISNLTGGEYNNFATLDRSQQLDAQPLINLCRAQPDRTVAEHLGRLLEITGLPVVGAVEFSYDGKGNCVNQNELYDGQERKTAYTYDEWDRVATTRLADGTVVGRTFAEQTVGQHVTRMNVKPGNTAQPEVTVGQQKFDSLLRLTEVSVGSSVQPYIEQYRYTGGQMQPSQRITALGTSDYEYKSELTTQPLSIKTGKEQPATYSYDPKTGEITKASNRQGHRTYRYTGNGQLAHESWTDTDGTTMETDYVTSLQGRQISRRDTGGLATLYTYDEFGRASTITQGTLKADFKYNALGQLERTTTENLVTKTKLVADVIYDTSSREVERTLSLSNQPPRTITQTWQGDDQLQSRHLSLDGRSLLKEEFVYDQRKRLIHHKCTGTAKNLPKDVHGNAITSQVFTFDGLDNVQRVVTQFENGLSDDARFVYAADDLCQLREITHTYTDGGYSKSQTFEYDAVGNMLNDEGNQRLIYDSQGHLIEVQDPTGKQTLVTYRYDGHGHLVGVQQGNETEETLRFYDGYNLSHTRKGDKYTQYLFDGGRALGQQQVNDPNQTVMLMTDASYHVIGECLQSDVQTAVYSAYGVRSREDDAKSLLAFNSELCEEFNEGYMLGRGYRAYNANLMRFYTRDSFSPFGQGGMSAYPYGLGNPITFHDPSGHRSTNRRPTLPGYIDPPEEPEVSLMGKIGSFINLAIMLVAAIVTTIATLGMAAPFVVAAVIGLVITAVGVTVGVYGTLSGDEDLAILGNTMAMVGATIGGIAYGYGSYKKNQLAKLDANLPTSSPSGNSSSARRPSSSNEGQQPVNSLGDNALNQSGSPHQSSMYDPGAKAVTQNQIPGNNVIRSPSGLDGAQGSAQVAGNFTPPAPTPRKQIFTGTDSYLNRKPKKQPHALLPRIPMPR